LPPEALRARVFVWSTCRAILMPQGMVDSAWGLAERLFDSPTLGAVMLPWESVLSQQSLDPLCQLLAAGAPAGRALAAFQARPEVRRLGHRMCLFGDPRVRVAATAAGLVRPPVDRPEPEAPVVLPALEAGAPSGPSSEEETADLGLITRALIHYAGHAPPLASARAHRLLQGVRRFRLEARSGLPPGAGDRFRAAVLDYLIYRDDFSSDWSEQAIWTGDLTDGRRCSVCGSRLKVLAAAFRLHRVSPRRLSSCSCCDLVEDVPLDSSVSLSLLDGRALLLGGPLPPGRCAAALRANQCNRLLFFDWPAQEDGTPARQVEFPPGSLPLPTRAALYLVCRAQVHALFVRLRGSPREGQACLPGSRLLVPRPAEERLLTEEYREVVAYERRPSEAPVRTRGEQA
jgi:hypothetical protein